MLGLAAGLGLKEEEEEDDDECCSIRWTERPFLLNNKAIRG